RRACPMCLESWPYHRIPWDFALLTACPEHIVRLIDRCHRCGRRVGWLHPSVACCRCGADLREFRREVASAAEVAVARKMLALVREQAVPWLAPELTSCDRSDLVRLAMCLGMFLTGWTKNRRVESLVAAGPDKTAETMVAGIDAFADWPLAVVA